MWKNISVANEDARHVLCDILVLKYADRHYGLDEIVAGDLGVSDFAIDQGDYAFYSSKGQPKAKEVLALGVGPLQEFEYAEIEKFARKAVGIIQTDRPTARRVAFAIHGSGYGLDQLASFDSLIRGIRSSEYGRSLDIIIVEKNARLASALLSYLDHLEKTVRPTSDAGNFQAFTPDIAASISQHGTYEKRLFVAMPFKDDFLDHWEFAIQGAVHSTGYLCERLDYAAFTGDIVAEIQNRIEKSRGVVALLDESNANVFLEVGYAWGLRKPAILVLRNGSEPPFDVRGQRIVRYSRLGDLKTSLESEISQLGVAGVI